MHMSFNGKEHMHISIDWLHDLRALSFMAYGIPGKQILLLQDTLMQTELEMLMKEIAPQEDASMWETIS
jgi:hypothetical protein